MPTKRAGKRAGERAGKRAGERAGKRAGKQAGKWQLAGHLSDFKFKCILIKKGNFSFFVIVSLWTALGIELGPLRFTGERLTT